METTAAACGELAWPKGIAGFAVVGGTVKSLLKAPLHWLGAALGRHRWPVSKKGSLLILTYHRVLPVDHPDRENEQPGMYVSPETLAMHLQTLSKHFEFIHLDDWLSLAPASEDLSKRYCAITFDDGWKDNYDFAFPVLRQANVPATFFLVTSLVGTAYQFWPNRLARLLTSLPADSAADLLGRLESRGVVVKRIGHPANVDDIDHVIEACKALQDSELDQLFCEYSGTPPIDPPRDLMNWDEIEEMTESGLARFGSHTMNHTRLNADTPKILVRSEVADSRAELESRLAGGCYLFCYPNGDFTSSAVQVVKNFYIGAVSTESGWNTVDSDRYLLNRIGLHEDISSTPTVLLSRIGGLI